MSTLTDNQMLRLLGSSFNVPDEVLSTFDQPEDLMAWVERYGEGLTAPFNLTRDVRICYERQWVEKLTLNPSSKNVLFRFYEETEDPWMLVYSATGSGPDSLFFFTAATGTDEPPQASECMRCFLQSTSSKAALLCGKGRGITTLAINLPAFLSFQ